MQDRNSFVDSYCTRPCQEEEGNHEIYHSLTFNPEVADHRLSEGKMSMLETFKKSMSSLDKAEETKAEEERLSGLLRTSEGHCFQIKEESNQSEERSAKQEESDPQPKSHKESQLSQAHSSPAKEMQFSLIPLSSLDSRRLSMAAAITKAIQFLCRGVQVRKCCLNRLKVEECVLCFTEDFELMSLHVSTKGESMVYSIAGLWGVRKGLSSQNFKRYKEDAQIDEQLAFTIILPQRSFDLLARTAEERDVIIREMQLLSECS